MPFEIPKETSPSAIRTVTVGATASTGGTRDHALRSLPAGRGAGHGEDAGGLLPAVRGADGVAPLEVARRDSLRADVHGQSALSALTETVMCRELMGKFFSKKRETRIAASQRDPGTRG